MAFAIRRGELGDAAAIALVHVQSWRTTYRGIVPETYLAFLNAESRTELWRAQLFSKETLIFVAEDESGVFGFAAGGRARESLEHYDAEIYAIYLLDSRQRQGAGVGLMRTLARSLQSEGYEGVFLWVLEHNPAVGFYKRLGGEQIAQKLIEIGGVELQEIALGWRDIAKSFLALK